MKNLAIDLSRAGILAVLVCILNDYWFIIWGNSIQKSYIFTLDKLLHIIEYFILGFFCFRFLVISHKHVISFILGIFYSLIDELYQSTVIGRDSSGFDVIADIIGLILSILFIKLFLNSFVHDR